MRVDGSLMAAEAVSPANEQAVDKILKRFEEAKARRANWEDQWQDCYDYALPHRENIYGSTPGERRTGHLFDSTAIVGIQEFASRIQAGLAPAFDEWLRFDPGDRIVNDNDRQVAIEDLSVIKKKFFRSIRNSNFDNEFFEYLLELAIGTGVMLVDESEFPGSLYRVSAIPISSVWLERDPFDGIGAVYYCYKLRYQDLPSRHPSAKFNEEIYQRIQREPTKEITILDVTYRDWTHRADEAYRREIIICEHKERINHYVYVGMGSNPWIVARWSKSAGEVYGRGPLLNAIPDIKTINLVQQLILENAELAISGMWQADDDGVLNPETIRLVPGVIIPKDPNSNGLQSIRTEGRFDVSQFILDDLAHKIRKHLFNEQLGKPDKTPMTATEVAERMADLTRQIGAPLSRIFNEFIDPFVRRILYIMRKNGEFSDLKSGNDIFIGGGVIKISLVSELAKASEFSKISNLQQYLGILQGIYGPEVAMIITDPSRTALMLANLFEIEPDILRKPAEVQQMLSNFQALSQQAAQVQAQAAGGA